MTQTPVGQSRDDQATVICQSPVCCDVDDDLDVCVYDDITGDDGTSTEVQSSGVLMKEAENIYALWCTGRTYCEGMLVTLKLLKRQDLVSSIARLLRPVCDQIVSRQLSGQCSVVCDPAIENNMFIDDRLLDK